MKRRLALGLGAVGAVLAAGGGVAWWWVAARPSPSPPHVAPPPVATGPALAPPLLDFAGLLAHRAAVPTALRWAANPLVWVLDFPSLELQGQAMNRAAALIEKAQTPRDRVLSDAELAAAVAADQRSTADWYFGHNYRASDLTRMFDLAARQGLRLNPLEAWLRDQVELAGRVDRGRETAFITIPAIGAHVDAQMRSSVLRHELSHGQFFTLPFFAAHVMRIWESGFTEAERSAFRRFLGAEGYDTGQAEVMANEAMAYLLYTPDRRFFDPARDLGWSDAQAERLRALLREAAPEAP
ncbi:hypothetical protein [Sediminicoccus sp. KRV36]|uniref:hypothetical protein n=1 Tax=Sediminicoccus sp. KRV36 TaxID=3133721 RepID=UPI00200F88CB|nr:hypothetical protein [Sediminicoccus rosea]UPY37359.1 hypothetical protein LHU95_01330 [Sediminicoccus rosea]